MALQSYVNKEYALGVPGDMVNPGEGQNVFTPVNPKAEGDVNVGSFVFPGSDPYTQASNGASSQTAGTDTFSVSCAPTSGTAATGNLTVTNDGYDVTLESSVGAVDQTSTSATAAGGSLTVPVGTSFAGSVKIGSTSVATIAADGSVTMGSTLAVTGTNSTLTVSAVTYADGNIVITFTVAWTATGTATAVMGFVVRVQAYPNYMLDSEGTLKVPSGSTLSVAVRGDFYAKANTTATAGQKVFASTTDGSISTGTAGATVAGHVETGFMVKRGGSVGDLIVISNN